MNNLVKGLLSASLLSISSIASSGLLYMHQWGGDTLYTYDTDTNTQTTIGNTGVNNMGGLSFDNNGSLFGMNVSGNLYNINTSTGAASLIGNTGLGGIEGLTFSITGNSLLASGGSSLYSVDLLTAATTNLGNIGMSDVDGLTIASTSVNTMFGTFSAGTIFATDSNRLYSIDANTLATTSLGSVSANESLAFDSNGNLFGHDFYGDLYSIDLMSMNSTLVGSTSGPITGMAFNNSDNKVPEPSVLALMGLGLVGLSLSVRRKRQLNK